MSKSRNNLLSLLLALCMLFSAASPAFADLSVPTSDEVSEHEIRSAEISLQLATEAVVLLENDGTLPIAKENTKIALFGPGAIQTVKGGTGSGAVNNRVVYPDGTKKDGVSISVSVLEGFENAGYEVLTADFLRTWDETHPSQSTGMMSVALAQEEILPVDLVRETSAETNLAIYVINRNAGEGADRTPTKGDYYLADAELGNIALLRLAFEKVVVVLNVVSIDASWYEASSANASVLRSNLGQVGGDALVSLLNGTVTPSGKLTDTWASSLDDYPSTKYFAAINPDDPYASHIELYTEGIYTGYRYFDKYAADKVIYPFGYGLSYTTFDMTVDSVEVDGRQIKAAVTVTNTGDTYAGKEVVEVYFSAPAVELDKPYQELIAFGKTDTLAPGQSQTLEITFDAAEMSSYDEEKAAYVMEKGDYILRIGNSSRNTKPAARLTLADSVVTEQLANQMVRTRPGVNVGAAPQRSVPPYVPTIDTTVEAVEAMFQEELELFREKIAEGTALDDPATTDVTIALDPAALENREPVYADGVNENVHEYISATTDRVNVRGYNYETNTPYEIIRVYFDQNGAAVVEEPAELKDFRVKSGSEADGAAEYYTLLDVRNGVLTLEEFVSGLTISELANFVQGGNMSPTANGQSAGGGSRDGAALSEEDAKAIDDAYVRGEAGETNGLMISSRLIPNTTNADGPAGLRLTQSFEHEGKTYYQFNTAYPVGNAIAQSWNLDVAYNMGAAIGDEMVVSGVTMWLAPGMNIHRNPLCGRNFEYYSEDPLLSGMMAASETRGLQAKEGVGATIKHFVANSQETSRALSNSYMDERAMREIYLKGFEIAVKSAQPMGVMSCYNSNNNVPGSSDYELLENILRKEWGFQGMVMTDWGGAGGYSDARSMHAGNDIIMAGHNTSYTLGYITDVGPDIALDEAGLSIDGGYPRTVATTFAFGTFILNRATTDWGDYKPDPEGKAYVVKTSKQAFDETILPTVTDNVFTDKSVREIVTEMSDAGTASFEEDGDVVTITYKLVKVSSLDNVSRGHQDWPDTTDLLGDPDENTLALGDLQKSAIRILRMVMNSNQFADLVEIDRASYGATVEAGLKTFFDVAASEIR